MARITRSDLAVRVARAEANRRVRDRYAEALRAGYKRDEAAKLAQGNGPIVPIKSVEAASKASVPVLQVSESHPQGGLPSSGVAQNDARINPARYQPKPPEPTLTVPPNWEDLPWPQLRELATNIANKAVRSRVEAAAVIEAFLNK